MMLHPDGSTHEWLVGEPMQDLIVLQDDADSRIHYAQFVPQEGTHSSFAALKQVLQRAGRFCELYTDRGAHFCHTPVAGQAATTEHQGQVSRALKALGIRQILAYSPQALVMRPIGATGDARGNGVELLCQKPIRLGAPEQLLGGVTIIPILAIHEAKQERSSAGSVAHAVSREISS